MKQIKIFLLILACYIFFLNSYGLIDPDEPRYATTAKNMVIKGEYLIPEFNGKLRINKPPLTYWLIAISYKIFGINEFSARLPHAILGFFLIILLFLFTRDTLSSIILASSPFFIFFSRLCNTDMILNFFFSVSLLYFYRFYNENKIKYIIIFLFSYLLANLTKGPVAFLIPLIIVVFLISEKKIFYLKKISLIFIIFLCSISSLIWLLIVGIKTGDINSLKTLIFNETFGRVFKGYAHKEPFYFYLMYFPLIFLPWSIFFIWKIFNLKKICGNSFFKFNIIWFFTVFIFFSISKSKLLSYILPLSVPFSIICSELIKEIDFKINIQKILIACGGFLGILTGYLIFQNEFKINFLILVYLILGIILWSYLPKVEKKIALGIIFTFFITGILTLSGKYITDLRSEKFLQEIKFPNEFKLIVFRKKLTGTAFYKGNYKKVDSLSDIIKSNDHNVFILTSTGMFKKFLKNKKFFKVVYKTKGRVLLN